MPHCNNSWTRTQNITQPWSNPSMFLCGFLAGRKTRKWFQVHHLLHIPQVTCSFPSLRFFLSVPPVRCTSSRFLLPHLRGEGEGCHGDPELPGGLVPKGGDLRSSDRAAVVGTGDRGLLGSKQTRVKKRNKKQTQSSHLTRVLRCWMLSCGR